MSREMAVEAVNELQYAFPAYLAEFLEFHELSESVFFDKVEELRNHDIWVKKNKKWQLRETLV